RRDVSETKAARRVPLDGAKREKSILPNTNGHYTFESFVQGECNEFAWAACRKVAESPAIAYNPLYLHGSAGTGKTHLLCAIAHDIKRDHKELSILYVTAEDFTNNLIESIATKQTAGFRAKYRSRDVLLIDDIQFIQAKNKTQEALLHTFNTLSDLGHQIVISSDRQPESLHFVQDGLISRFCSGLVVDVGAPDAELRSRILLKKAEKTSFDLPDEIADYIATRAPNNVRLLEGLLTRVRAYAELKRVPLTLDAAKRALNGFGNGSSSKVLSVGSIQKKVASYCGLRFEDIISRNRARNVVRARQIAMYLCRELLEESYPSIGKQFSGLCHAAAIHSYNIVASKLKTDPVLTKIVLELKNELVVDKAEDRGLVQIPINWDTR
ncbi:MAG: chromosomal replication initiator protein DnaA, partial [Candidatus Coatesbacteria bacterium]|nr:chromosomal replication initiator protein DnaA [Candidatus Coatesbacteria bacterium]